MLIAWLTLAVLICILIHPLVFVAMLLAYALVGLGFWLSFKTFALPQLRKERQHVTTNDHLFVAFLWPVLVFAADDDDYPHAD